MHKTLTESVFYLVSPTTPTRGWHEWQFVSMYTSPGREPKQEKMLFNENLSSLNATKHQLLSTKILLQKLSLISKLENMEAPN